MYPAQAKEQYRVGAQVCEFMNLNNAKNLQYRAEGVINNADVSQWVVCPIAAQAFGDHVDSVARTRNLSEVGAEAQLRKISGEQSWVLDEDTLPRETGVYNLDGYNEERLGSLREAFANDDIADPPL